MKATQQMPLNVKILHQQDRIDTAVVLRVIGDLRVFWGIRSATSHIQPWID